MNKRFRKLTNTILALVLSLGMVFGLIPSTLLLANAAQVTEQVATVDELQVESGYEAAWTRTVFEPGNIQFQCNDGGKLRVRGNLSEGYTYTAGDVVTINYTTALNGTEVELCYNTEASYVRLGTLSNAEEQATFTLPETDKLGGEIQPQYIRFKNNNCDSGNTFGVYKITFTRTTEETEQPVQPETPSANTQFAAASCDGGSYETASDGTVTYSYNKGAWNYLNFDVKESDLSEYDKIVFDITPVDGMTLGIGLKKGDELTKLRDIWAKETIGGQRQTFEYSLSTKDFNSVQFRVDWPVWEDAPAPEDNGQAKQLIIHSIKLVKASGTEPVNPSGKPSVKVNVAETASVYNPEVNSDGSVKFTYNNVTGEGWWHTVILDVNNCDITKYNQLRIDITPAGDDMTLGVYDYSEKPCFRGHEALPKSGRQVLKVDLTQNVEKLKLFCDATLGDLGQRSFVIHRVWLCDKDEPEYTLTDKATFTTVTIGDSCGTVTEDKGGANATITPGTSKTKFFTNFTGYTYKAGDVYVVSYDGIDSWASAEQVLIGYGLSSGQYIDLKNPQNAGDMVYYELPETEIFTDNQPVLVRYKGVPNSDSKDIHLKGAHIYDGEEFAEYLKSLEAEEPEETRYVKVNLTASSGYRGTVNADGSVTIKYTRAGADNWDTIKLDIVNDDYDKYDQVRFELTPAKDMQMAILANKENEVWYRHHNDFDTNDKQIVKVSLKKDDSGKEVEMPVTGLKLFCDSINGVVGERELTIHKAWLCNSEDPDFVPTEKATFKTFTGSGFDLSDEKEGGIATLTSRPDKTKDGKIRLYANFEYNKEFSYASNDVFALKWNGMDIDDIKTFETIIGFGDGSTDHISLSGCKEAGDYFYFTLPEDTEGKFKETQPKYIRFKGALGADGSTTKIDGMHIYDGAEWRKFISSFTYNEEDCPQGVAVSYYSDIYSRGFAWATTDQINEQELQYIQVSDETAKEDIDWNSEDIQIKKATRGEDREDKNKVIWHMYKVHLENLEPGSYWYFRVGTKDKGFSDVGSFRIEEAETDKLTFVHLTDCQEGNQSGYTRWAKVLDAAYKTAPDSKFVAFTGDLTNDSHANLTMEQWNWGLGEPKKNLLNTVIMPSSGNHDEWPYSFTDRFDIYWADYIKTGDKHPVTGKIITPEDDNYDIRTGGCYSFMYGDDIAFINLNTNDTNNLPNDFQSQYNWLVEQLEKYKDVKWKIVQVHKGIMSTGNHTNDGEVDQIRDMLPPLFAHYKVDLVLQGHDHVYTRSRSYYYGTDFDGVDYGGIKVEVDKKATEEAQENYPGRTMYKVSTANTKYTGQKPCWLNGEIFDGRDEEHAKWVVNGKEREITSLEPNGTHYVTINYCANKSYAVADTIDKVIYPGYNPITTIDLDGNEVRNGTSIQLKNSPMYGVIQIDGDTLIYDSYVYNPSSKESTLYDTFAVKKGDADLDTGGLWNRGYRNRTEGFTEAVIENVMVEGKEYDGKPVKLNLQGFVTNQTSFIDYSKLEFHTVGDNGFDSTTELPSERGTYTMTISSEVIIETDKDPLMYNIEKKITFTIK